MTTWVTLTLLLTALGLLASSTPWTWLAGRMINRHLPPELREPWPRRSPSLLEVLGNLLIAGTVAAWLVLAP